MVAVVDILMRSSEKKLVYLKGRCEFFVFGKIVIMEILYIIFKDEINYFTQFSRTEITGKSIQVPREFFACDSMAYIGLYCINIHATDVISCSIFTPTAQLLPIKLEFILLYSQFPSVQCPIPN